MGGFEDFEGRAELTQFLDEIVRRSNVETEDIVLVVPLQLYILLGKRRIGVYMAIAVIPFTANDTQLAEKTPRGTFFLLFQTDVCNQELTTARSIASL